MIEIEVVDSIVEACGRRGSGLESHKLEVVLEVEVEEVLMLLLLEYGRQGRVLI